MSKKSILFLCVISSSILASDVHASRNSSQKIDVVTATHGIIATLERHGPDALCDADGGGKVTGQSYGGRLCIDSDFADLMEERCGKKPRYNKTQCYGYTMMGLNHAIRPEQILTRFQTNWVLMIERTISRLQSSRRR